MTLTSLTHSGVISWAPLLLSLRLLSYILSASLTPRETRARSRHPCLPLREIPLRRIQLRMLAYLLVSQEPSWQQEIRTEMNCRITLPVAKLNDVNDRITLPVAKLNHVNDRKELLLAKLNAETKTDLLNRLRP